MEAISKSLETLARVPYSQESCDFSPLRVPGDLGALPLDIIWMILDEILTGDGQLTHTAICTIRKLSTSTNKALSKHVGDYLRTKKSLRYLARRLSELVWHPWRDTIWGPMGLETLTEHIDRLPIKEDVDTKSDLFTEIICADCPDCFEWLRNRIHGLGCSGCNKNGWNFVSLAVQAGSIGMLKYFFMKQPESLPLLWSYSNYLSAMIDRPVNLLVRGKKVRFIEQLLEFLEPRLNIINYPEAYRTGIAETPEINALTWELSKYRSSMCRFATPYMAECLKGVGVDLCSFEDVYHAAIFNGRDFLDYIHENSTVSKKYVHWFNGKTAFECAVEENLLESVRWLKQHGGDDIGRFAWSGLLNKVASQVTDESEVMLQELLSPSEGIMLGHFECAMVVRAILRKLVPSVKAEDRKRDVGHVTEGEFLSWKRQQEGRAIRKCAIILNVSWKVREMRGQPVSKDMIRPSSGFTTDVAIAVQKFNIASNTAQEAGLLRLADAIKRLFL